MPDSPEQEKAGREAGAGELALELADAGTAYLLGDGPDPAPVLAEAARVIERGGADFIAIPCNSAHAFLDTIRDAVSIPVLDMIELAVDAAAERCPDASKIGVLAASGAVRVGLYERWLENRGLQPVYPDGAIQEEVMAAILDIKGGAAPGSDPRFVAAARHLHDAGADCLIMGCTEIPLALAPEDCPVPAIDANQVLVEATLAEATGRRGSGELAAEA